MLFPPTHANRTGLLPEMSEAASAGILAVRSALERLFHPYAVTIETMAGGPDALATLASHPDPQGAAFDVDGQVKARLVLLSGNGEDTRLAAALLRRSWSREAGLDDEAREAFAEMANIVASSFLNGVATKLGLKLIPSIPLLGDRPVQRVVKAIAAAPEWTFGARFTIAVPGGDASGLFIATPVAGGTA